MLLGVRIVFPVQLHGGFVVLICVCGFVHWVRIRDFFACFVVRILCVRLLVRFFCGCGRGGRWGCG